MGDEKTIYNSKVTGGFLLCILGVVFNWFMWFLDDLLYYTGGSDLGDIIGDQLYYLISYGVPVFLIAIGFTSVIYGFYKASK